LPVSASPPPLSHFSPLVLSLVRFFLPPFFCEMFKVCHFAFVFKVLIGDLFALLGNRVMSFFMASYLSSPLFFVLSLFLLSQLLAPFLSSLSRSPPFSYLFSSFFLLQYPPLVTLIITVPSRLFSVRHPPTVCS